MNTVYRMRGDGFEAIEDISVTRKGEELTTDDGDNYRIYNRTPFLMQWDRRCFQAWSRVNKLGEIAYVYTECRNGDLSFDHAAMTREIALNLLKGNSEKHDELIALRSEVERLREENTALRAKRASRRKR